MSLAQLLQAKNDKVNLTTMNRCTNQNVALFMLKQERNMEHCWQGEIDMRRHVASVTAELLLFNNMNAQLVYMLKMNNYTEIFVNRN